MRCPKCGKKTDDNVPACPVCGTQFTAVVTPTAAAKAPGAVNNVPAAARMPAHKPAIQRCGKCGKKLENGVCPICGGNVSPQPVPAAPKKQPAPNVPNIQPVQPKPQSASVGQKSEALKKKAARSAAAVKKNAAGAVNRVAVKTNLPAKTIAVAAGIILAIIVITLFAFLGSNSRKIVGKWQLTEVTDGYGNVEKAEKGEDIIMEFKRNGMLDISYNGKTQSCFYEVKGRTVLLKSTSKDAGINLERNVTRQMAIEKIGFTKMVLVESDSGEALKMTFKRKL